MNHLLLLLGKNDSKTIALKLGDRVTVEFEDGRVEIYEVGREADFLRDPPIVTLDIPLCRAIEGRRIGEWVTYEVPKAGKVTARVVELKRGQSWQS